jgi:hypothetical protein
MAHLKPCGSTPVYHSTPVAGQWVIVVLEVLLFTIVYVLHIVVAVVLL